MFPNSTDVMMLHSTQPRSYIPPYIAHREKKGSSLAHCKHIINHPEYKLGVDQI